MSVDSSVEERFRKVAKAVHGKNKGYLGRAVTEAMQKWTEDKEQSDTITFAMRMLDDPSMKLGRLKYKQRDELHER